MKEITNLEELLDWANKTYYPFKWVIEGPNLFISNYGMDKCKADGLAYYPTIKSLVKTRNGIIEFCTEAQKYIKTLSEFLLKEPKNGDINIEFNNEEQLKKGRKLHYEKNNYKTGKITEERYNKRKEILEAYEKS